MPLPVRPLSDEWCPMLCRLARRTLSSIIALPLLAGVTYGLLQRSLPDSNAKLLSDGLKNENKGNIRLAVRDYASVLGSGHDVAKAYLQLGIMKGESGDIAGAAASFQAAIRSDPTLAEAHYNLGVTMIAGSPSNPDWSDAILQFQDALRLRPKYPEAMNMLGVSLLRSGNAPKAIDQFKAALQLNNNSAETHFNLAKALSVMGENSEAYVEDLTALKLKGTYPGADIALGNICFKEKKFGSAAGYFKSALTANPDLQDAHYGLAKALQAQGDKADAGVEFKEAQGLIQRQADGVQSSHLSNESLDLAKAGNFAAAITSAKQAISLEPDNAAAHFNLGLLLADSGQLPSAILELRKAISLQPLQSRFYVDMSRMQERTKDREDAIDSLRQAGLLDPSNTEIAEQMKSLLEKGQALQHGHSAATVKKAPFPYGAPSDTVNGHFAFGNQLVAEGDPLGAIGEFLRALALQPDNSEVRYKLALTYMKIRDDSKAELELRKVLMLSPDSAEAHMTLGRLLCKRKDDPDAASEFKSVLLIEPGNWNAKQLLSRCSVNVGQ